MKNNFCIAPFVHLNVGPRDEITPCCVYENQSIDEFGEIHIAIPGKVSNTLLGTWNSPTWNHLRESFLNNERPDACFMCWDYEDSRQTEETDDGSTDRSYRMHANVSNKEYLNLTEKLETPAWLQLKLGAKCNLTCRICSANSSNKWLAEEAISDLAVKQDLPYERVSRADQKKWSAKKQKESAWLYTDKFWNELKSISKGIRRLDFTGGEPLLIVEHYQYLEWCVEQGYAKNIYLDYCTNGTVDLTDNMKELWSHFKFINMTISMDAYGKLAEYIRTGIVWEHSEKNILEYNEYFRKIAKNSIGVNLSPTISSYNVYYIDELTNWCIEQDVRADFNLLHVSEECSVKHLSPFAKTKVTEKLKYIISSGLVREDDNYGGVTSEQIEMLINFVNSSTEDKSKEFCARIKKQERIHKIAHNKIMDYKKSFPEWWEILNE